MVFSEKFELPQYELGISYEFTHGRMHTNSHTHHLVKSEKIYIDRVRLKTPIKTSDKLPYVFTKIPHNKVSDFCRAKVLIFLKAKIRQIQVILVFELLNKVMTVLIK